MAARLEVYDNDVFGEVVEQRRDGGAQISGVELDARKRAARFETLDLLFPVRADVRAQALQRHALAKAICRRGPAPRPQQKLAAGVDGNARHCHHRSLVDGIEQPERVDLVTGPLGANGRVRGSREHVEDSPAQGELPGLLDQWLPRIAHLDEAARDCDRVRPRAGRQEQRAARQVGRRDGRAHHRAARRHDDGRRGRVGEHVQSLEAFVDCLVEGRRPVEEGDRDLGEHVRRRPAGEPRPELVAEPLGCRRENQHGSAGVTQSTRDRAGHDRPRRSRQSRNSQFAGATHRPRAKFRRRLQSPLPQRGQGNSSQPSDPARLNRSIARSMPASSATSSAVATPSTIFGSRSASAFVNRPST